MKPEELKLSWIESYPEKIQERNSVLKKQTEETLAIQKTPDQLIHIRQLKDKQLAIDLSDDEDELEDNTYETKVLNL